MQSKADPAPQDPNVAVLVATAGGQVFTPELGDVPAFGRTVSKFCTDASIGKKRIKKYLILPHLLASLKAEEHKAFLDAKESYVP